MIERARKSYQGALSAIMVAGLLTLVVTPGASALPEGAEIVLELPPGEGNPRNSEGDFIALQDGRILFVYTHFTGGASDHAEAHLAVRESRDQGRSWTKEDEVLFANEAGQNIMSVSLLRLRNGNIALFYLQKNSQDDCMPVIRLSRDEAKTWSPARPIVEKTGYYVLNNDRVVQLENGRILAPLALHTRDNGKWHANASMVIAMSDDEGETFRVAEQAISLPDDDPAGVLQEPGIVELHNGDLLMFIRTAGQYQYFSRSQDQGMTWSLPEASTMRSPRSPASIERLPGASDIVALWNDHDTMTPAEPEYRTPLVLARSADAGVTWTNKTTLEDHPDGWYCYTAMEWTEDALLLGYCAGLGKGTVGLGHTRIVRLPLSLLTTDHEQ